MMWNIKYKRIVKTFALFPMEIDGCYRWLETVYISQKRRHDWLFGWYWVDEKFVTKEDYLKYKGKSV